MKKFTSLIAVYIFFAISVNAQKTITWGVKGGMSITNSNFSAKDISSSIDLGSKVGFYIGGVNTISLNKSFDLQTELLYSMEGFKMSLGKGLITDYIINYGENEEEDYDTHNLKDLSVSITTGYFRLPVLLKYKTIEGLSVMAGPYFAYRTSLKLATKNISGLLEDEENRITFNAATSLAKEIIENNTNKFDYGLSFGVEYSFKKLFIDVKYNYSLSNRLKDKVDLSGVGTTQDIKEIEDEVNTAINILKPHLRNSSLQFGLGYRF